MEPAAFSWVNIEPVRIRFGGRDFIASPQMAGAFLRRAQQLIDDGDAQLVPLLHRGGIELLYVTKATPFSVHDATERATRVDRVGQ